MHYDLGMIGPASNRLRRRCSMVVERVLWVGCAAFALSACEYRHVESRGSVTNETRDVTTFDAIEFQGDARLEITIGEAAAVTVRGQPNVVSRTQTRVTGNTLYIEVERKEWTWGRDRERLTLLIKVPQLRALQVDGGNDVRLDGFKGGESTIEVNGAARIRASGALDQLTVHLDGAGYADLSRLIAKDAKVTVDGVGNVIVNPEESLDATVNGVGAILYTGTPRQVNSSMNGLGTIGKKDQGRTRHRGWDRERDYGWNRDRGRDDSDADAEEADTI
jgi:hypothetical protein